MGYVISKDGFKLDLDKVKVVKDMLKFIFKNEILSLLGFINYLVKFLLRLFEVV